MWPGDVTAVCVGVNMAAAKSPNYERYHLCFAGCGLSDQTNTEVKLKHLAKKYSRTIRISLIGPRALAATTRRTRFASGRPRQLGICVCPPPEVSNFWHNLSRRDTATQASEFR